MIARRIFLCAVLASAFSAAPGWAQVDEDTEGRTPIELGRVLLYPTYRTDVLWTDNLFYDNPDFGPVMTYEVTATPSILFELPFSKSLAHLGYAYRYRDYSTDVRANSANYLLADAQLQFANGLTLNFRDDFETGVLDTKVFDPGGAVTYKGERVDVNVLSLGAGYGAKTWELTANGGVNRVFFPNRTLTSFYDVDGWSTGLTYRYKSSPVLRWFLDATFSRTRLEIPPQPNFAGEAQVEYRRGVDAGVEYDLGPGNRIRLEFGLPYYDYRSDAPTQFRTLTGKFEYTRTIPAWMTANFQLIRAAYPSTFLDNNYYLDERLGFSLSNDRAARVELGGSVTYYLNRYPVPPPPGVFGGERRTDRTVTGEAYVGYRFAGGVSWRLFFRGETRYSTIPFFEYGHGSIGTSFVIGG